MTPTELRALIDKRAAGDAEFAALVDPQTFDAVAAAAALSVGRTRLASHLITERGVISALGPVAGEAALSGLESFAAATLPDGHPLQAAHPGIKRVLSWLKPPSDGIDIGDPLTQSLLDTMVLIGVLTAPSAAVIKALAMRPDPVSADAVIAAMRV